MNPPIIRKALSVNGEQLFLQPWHLKGLGGVSVLFPKTFSMVCHNLKSIEYGNHDETQNQSRT
jgi:hypothetical protein